MHFDGKEKKEARAFMKNFDFRVVGAGLAGSEAALVLSREGARVQLWEQKPKKFSAAHQLAGAAELVCSNSFKSEEVENAHGLMKAELRLLGSPLLQLAKLSRVPGGKALSVDREAFSQKVSEALEAQANIEWIREEASELPQDDVPTLIATGPLGSESLMKSLETALGSESLYFYDATAPVVELESLDLAHFFWGSRYTEDSTDYLNLPLDKEQYLEFRHDILGAEKVPAQGVDEKLQFFEGCLPIEVLAERGEEVLRYSCMKPTGFTLEDASRPYALIQFRREKAAGDLLSMVGFQTRMKWPEQARVLRKLPGMANADFARMGAMHRNQFINSPQHLNNRLQSKSFPQLFFAGQITGSEGYTEALATGHFAALQMLQKLSFPKETAIGSLVHYLVHSDARYFQPMNFNFGLLSSLLRQTDSEWMKALRRRSKRERSKMLSDYSLGRLQSWIDSEMTESRVVLGV
ncbi:MAG: methylenetetrahydrofolate--tRNA-(uracil(54)-C(5))-methyltransferase (FADH(2)-oxidizing) TrmFO [Bradymonadales bacterium]|nr:MAG: methylenetetrahydrofolate--tRNA-(uracil(54)-C(5))-methyltransferase (FADH(2)-oxidizing) TrmFO [Bradymonadales bacterium]